MVDVGRWVDECGGFGVCAPPGGGVCGLAGPDQVAELVLEVAAFRSCGGEQVGLCYERVYVVRVGGVVACVGALVVVGWGGCKVPVGLWADCPL